MRGQELFQIVPNALKGYRMLGAASLVYAVLAVLVFEGKDTPAVKTRQHIYCVQLQPEVEHPHVPQPRHSQANQIRDGPVLCPLMWYWCTACQLPFDAYNVNHIVIGVPAGHDTSTISVRCVLQSGQFNYQVCKYSAAESSAHLHRHITGLYLGHPLFINHRLHPASTGNRTYTCR